MKNASLLGDAEAIDGEACSVNQKEVVRLVIDASRRGCVLLKPTKSIRSEVLVLTTMDEYDAPIANWVNLL